MSDCALLVVGGGPAGHTVATTFRDAGGAGTVVLVAGEGRAPYRRPPLSKELLRGEAEPDEIVLDGLAAQGVELRPETVVALDPADRAATLSGGDRLTYDRCVLATGASPVRPPAQVDGDRVHVLRTVEDALALREAAQAGTRVLVVGSGFIGCEAASSLRARGCEVTLASQEAGPQHERLGPEVAERLAAWLEEDGVDAHYGTDMEELAPGADLVLVAAGVEPNADLAREAGIALADGGEIAAGPGLATSAEAVWACGDCCRAEHAIAGRPLHIEHWGDALAQGEVAGRAAAGDGDARWTTVPGFWSTIGGRTVKFAGWGDGHDEVSVADHGDGAFTAWFGLRGTCVGVLAHERDGDYEAGRERIEAGGPLP